MNFPEILKELRKRHNLSQSALAKKIGVSQASVGYWEKGQRTPTITVIEDLAKYFGVSTGYLMGTEPLQKDISTEWKNRLQTLSKYLENTPEFKQHEEMLKETLADVLEEQQREYETAKRFEKYGFPDADSIKKISDPYLKLNKKGQDKAIEQVELLTKIPEYRKDE